MFCKPLLGELHRVLADGDNNVAVAQLRKECFDAGVGDDTYERMMECGDSTIIEQGAERQPLFGWPRDQNRHVTRDLDKGEQECRRRLG